MLCKDDSVTYLTHLGYNTVKFPRASIVPLLVISGQRTALEALGPLSDFVTGATYTPQVICDEPAPDITGKKTNKLELSVGLDLLNRLLSVMGAASGKIDASYQNARSIQLTFKNVLSDYVYPSEIDKCLLSGKPVMNSLLKTWMDKVGEAFIITRTIKSKSFGVTAYDSSGSALNMDVQGIQNVIGASGKISPSAENSSEIQYEGTKMLSFGFQAISFCIQNNGFKLALAKAPVVLKGGGAVGEKENTVIFIPNELVDIKF